ncbi:MAG: argininosuccinate lyase [bacterium]
MKKPWGGRFSKDTNKLVEKFTESISFDRRLYAEDIEGSTAHVKMLKKQKVITAKEAEKIIKGLQAVKKEIDSGSFEFKESYEDIHMAIENRLKEMIGEEAGKLHTARSRNDQVATDFKLYLKKKTMSIYALLENLQRVFVEKAKEYLDQLVPGYTHLQRAQPVFLSHYLLAYVEMWERDKGRLVDCYKRMDVLPLGSGAMSGTTFPLDREYVAKLLDFSDVTRNSMDAVSDRDFAIELLSALSVLMMHLSRLCEDMILWNSYEFGFVILPDEFCTGSSIMPQKKNPDVLELTRGKTGRVYGDLISLLTMMKGLPLTYNRDMQEDKEPVFDAVDTVSMSLEILGQMFEKAEFKKDRLEREAAKGFILATEIADYLAKKGVPFRTAHEITGKIVSYCEKNSKELTELTIGEFRKFSSVFEKDIYDAIDPKKAVSTRNVKGGTGIKSVEKAIKFWDNYFKDVKAKK